MRDPRERWVFGRLDLGRLFAILLLAVLVLAGSIGVVVPFALRSPWVRDRIEHGVADLVRSETNLSIHLTFARATWPPGVVVRNVKVDSDDPKKPLLTAQEVRLTVKPFALLSLDPIIDAVEADGVNIDADLLDGAPTNVVLKLKPGTPRRPWLGHDPPLRTLALTNVHGHVTSRTTLAAGIGTTAKTTTPVVLDLIGLDVDIDVAGDASFVYDVRVQKGTGTLVTPRTELGPPPQLDRFAPKEHPAFVPHEVTDEDAICSMALDAQIIDAPGGTTFQIRKLDLDGRIDIDDRLGTTPSCFNTRVAPEQIINVHLAHLELGLPKIAGKSPELVARRSDSHIGIRSSATFFDRYIALPPMAGWTQLEITPSMRIDFGDPLGGVLRGSMVGTVEGHNLQLAQFTFGTSIQGDFFLKPQLLVGSKHLAMEYGGGHVTVDDLSVDANPNQTGKMKLPIKATIGIRDLKFPGLMRELAVSKASWVRWDFDDATVKVSGFLDPLMVDGDLKAQTKGFELATAPVELPNAGHMVGLSKGIAPGRADIDAVLKIRADALRFEQIHAKFGHTVVAARALLGFNNELEVDIDSDKVDLTDLTPLAAFPISGVGRFHYKVRGVFQDPVGDGSLTLADAGFDGFPLGDIDNVDVHFRGTTIDMSNLKARYEESVYSVPSMRVLLGRPQGPEVDAIFSSKNFALADFYSIFHLEDDPRWKEIQGHIGFDGRAAFVVGGKEDVCHGGILQIDAAATVLSLDLFGERFNGGSADISLDWVDRDGGALGMNLDVRSAVLKKKGGGTITASGKVEEGGKLFLRAAASSLPLRELAATPPTMAPLDATIDAVADIGGTMDAMLIDADVQMSPLKIAGKSLGASHLRVRRLPSVPNGDSTPPDARGCYTPEAVAPFDAVRFNADPVDGEYSFTGDLFDRSVRLDDFRLTDQRKKIAHGKVKIVDLDLAPIARMQPKDASVELSNEAAPEPLGFDVVGKMSADITLDRYPVSAWANSAGRIDNLTLDVTRDDVGVYLAKAKPIIFGDDGVSLDETTFDLRFGIESTQMLVSASLDRTAKGRDPATGSPRLAASLVLPSLPLSKIADFTTKIERADGTASARVNLTGTLDAPVWNGELDVDNATFAPRGFSMPVSGVSGKIIVDPTIGVRIRQLHGEVGGGTLDVSGGAKINGFNLGDVDVRIVAHDVHGRMADGLAATADAELRVAWSPAEPGVTRALPARLEGSIDIESFLYEKPVKLFDVNSFQQAKRTDVGVYDPTRDTIAFDIDVRAPHGLRAKNNLVDAVVDVGAGGLRVTGTNQQFGLVGSLHVASGGTFRLQGKNFEIRTGELTFDDPTKVSASIDVVAVYELRRVATSSTASAEWRLKLHAFGSVDDLKFELTSEPALAQEDILYLLAVGMTRAEASQLAAGGLINGGFNVLTDVSGVDQTLRQAIPIIDDYRFGTAYNPKTYRTEPQVTLGTRLTDTVRATLTSGIGEGSELLGNIEWQLARKISLQGSYDNVNDVSSATLGNIGLNLRYRIEFGD